MHKSLYLSLTLSLFAFPAWSQNAAAPAAQGTTQAAPTTTGASAESRFGLKAAVSQKRLITFEEALERASVASFDLRLAQEKIAQQQAQVRRAWASILPQVSASGSYSLNCIGGTSDNLFSCADQTVEFVSAESLDQQAALYRGVGGIAGAVAAGEQDPDLRQQLIEQSQQLNAVGDVIEAQKDDIEPVVVSPANLVTGGIQVVQPLFNGRALPLLQNAYSAVDAVTMARNQGQVALLYGVARAYYGAYTAKRFVEIADQQLGSAIKHMEAVKSRVELNSATPLALRRAELDVLRAKQSVRSATSARDGAIATLGNLMDIDEAFDIQAPKPLAFKVGNDAETLIQAAYDNRVDMQLARISLKIADRGKTDAWMTFLPSVNLVGQAGATSNISGFVAAPISASLSVQASIPIYDGGARYAQMREARSKVREEILKIRQLEQKVAGQIRGNLLELELKEGALELAKEGLALAKQTAAQADDLRGLGAATDLDVSDAQLGVFGAELEFVQAELAVEQARMDLSYISGSFAKEFTDVPTALSDKERDAVRKRIDESAQEDQ